jgi:hypothetical protein
VSGRVAERAVIATLHHGHPTNGIVADGADDPLRP